MDAHTPVVRDGTSPRVVVEHSIQHIRHAAHLARLSTSSLLSTSPHRQAVHEGRLRGPARLNGGHRGVVHGIYLGETTPGRDSTPLPDTVHRARQGNPNSDERHAAQQVLDGLTDDVLAISRRNGFDAKKEIQIAVILDDYHFTSRTNHRPDQLRHFRVIFFELVNSTMRIQVWRNANGSETTEALHVYPEGRDDLYLRPNSPQWIPDSVRSLPLDNQRLDDWVVRHGARIYMFRSLKDIWKASPVQGTRFTLAQAAQQAQRTLEATPLEQLPEATPPRTEEPRLISQARFPDEFRLSNVDEDGYEVQRSRRRR